MPHRTSVRILLWMALLVLFVWTGLQGLQARRIDAEVDALGFGRVATDPVASADRYLSDFNLSVAAIERATAGVPIDEPIVFIRRDNPAIFQEFSILSYAIWPRRLYAVICADNGQPARGTFAPPFDTATVAIVDMPSPPPTTANDTLEQVAPTTWILRSTSGRAWAPLCR